MAAQAHMQWFDDLMLLADSRGKSRMLLAALLIPVGLALAALVFFMTQLGQADPANPTMAAAPMVASLAEAPPLDFPMARDSANAEAMRHAVELMWADGKIKKGMTVQQVIKVLGVPDNTTNRYVKGGFSIGYSALQPSKNNYDLFFWLHFKANGDADRLVGWWEASQ